MISKNTNEKKCYKKKKKYIKKNIIFKELTNEKKYKNIETLTPVLISKALPSFCKEQRLFFRHFFHLRNSFSSLFFGSPFRKSSDSV